MEVHPRMKTRNLAEIDHSKALLEIILKYELTYGEIFTILSSAMTRWAGYLKVDEDEENKAI